MGFFGGEGWGGGVFVYVLNKQLIIYVYLLCQKRYVLCICMYVLNKQLIIYVYLLRWKRSADETSCDY